MASTEALVHDTLAENFAARVEASPNRIAVRDEKRTLTFVELDQMANTIIAQFPFMPTRVGIVMDHGVEMIASIWAILKAGAGYVPAEPSFPPERITYMMKESEVDFIITQQHYDSLVEDSRRIYVEQGFVAEEGAASVNEQTAPSDIAYVLYTSGTTGYPKGVVVEQRNVCNYVRAFCREFQPSSSDIMLQNSVCSFDIFVEEVFPVLLAGGSLAIPESFTRSHFPSLMNFVDEHRVTIMSGFPYLFWDMNELDEIPVTLRLLISGGDVLKASYVSQLIKEVTVYNTYGPTETTVCASYFKCNGYEPLEDGTYPIGKPVHGAKVVICDESLQPAKIGEIGEICIAGKGVSRGYLKNNVQSEVFLTDDQERRWYRSGDLGYVLPDGNIAFIKRNDAQVMIRGKRVEPQEVETVLERNEGIAHAVVTAANDENGLAYLTAYLVPASKSLRVSRIKKYLGQHVPDYMIPEFFVTLSELPLTLNGKVDRRALPVILKGGSL